MVTREANTPSWCVRRWGAPSTYNDLEWQPRCRQMLGPPRGVKLQAPSGTEPAYFLNLRLPQPVPRHKAPHFTKAVPTSRRAPNLAGGGEGGGERGQGARCLTGHRDCGRLPGKGPVGCCLPPTPWEGPRGRSHFPGLWPPGQSCLRPLQRGRVHCTGSTLLLRVQQRPWGYLARDGAPLPPGYAEKLLEAKN